MKRTPGWFAALTSLVVPVCLGLSLYLGFQYLIDQKYIVDETVLRYLTGHPVSRITVAMFFIGMSSVLLIGWNLFQQFSGEDLINLELKRSANSQEADKSKDVCDLAIDHADLLMAMPSKYQGHYLWERLLNAVHSIYRTGTTAGVEDELKYLSDLDQERQQQRYALVRILIWATPMLGFLGTVLGISQALGGISIGPDNDFQQMMNGLRGNLYIAFDTTALALTFAMGMMFSTFFAERFESQLLRLVDRRARSEIARQYELALSVEESESQQVVEAIQEVVESQTEIWRGSIRKAEQAWTASLTQTNDMVRSNLSESLDENVAALAHYLGEAIEKADAAMSQRWSQWQVGLSENARQMERHMVLLSEQTSSVKDIVKSLEDRKSYEAALQHQQEAIAATKRTHEILNQLLDQVEASASAVSAGTESKHFFPLPVATSATGGLRSVELADHETSGIRIFDEERFDVEDLDYVDFEDADEVNPSEVSSSTADSVAPADDSPATIPLSRADSNSAKVLKAVDGNLGQAKQDVCFARAENEKGDRAEEVVKDANENQKKSDSEVIFVKRPENRRAA